eukprot:gene727-8979_t
MEKEEGMIPPHLNLKNTTDLKMTLASHTSVFCSNKQIVFGGLVNKKKSKELFEVTKNELEQLEPTGDIPPERTSHSAVVRKISEDNTTKETMIIFGGLSGKTGGFKTMSDVYEYSVDENSWRQLYKPKDLLHSRKEHSAIYIEETDSMVIYGGILDNSKTTNSMIEFSFKEKSWKTINVKVMNEGLLLSNQKEEIEGRSGHTANYYNNRMYVFGGITENGFPLNDLWEFNFSTSTWQKLSTPFKSSKIPYPVYGHQSFLSSEYSIIIFGGRDKNSYFSQIHCYDIITKKWEKFKIFGNSSKNLQIRTFSNGSVIYDGSIGIYYLGGKDAKSHSSELMYFEFDKKETNILVDEKELAKNFSKLLNEKNLSDAIIEVQGENFHVHKLIISSCPELMSLMKDDIIIIDDLSPDVVYNILEYLYGNIPTINGKNIVNVIIGANKFKIKPLANWCESKLQEDFIDDSNFLEIFSLAKDEQLFDIVIITLSYMFKTWNTSQHLVKKLNEEKLEFVKKNLKNKFEKKLFSNEMVHPYVYLRYHLSNLRYSLEGDINLILGDESNIKAHKLILSARCTYFQTLFSGSFSDSSSIDIIFDMTDDSITFNYILDYIYGINVHFETNTEEEMIDALLKSIILSNLMVMSNFEFVAEDFLLKRISSINAFQIYCFCCTQNKYYQTAFIKKECIRLLRISMGNDEANSLIKQIDEQFEEQN